MVVGHSAEVELYKDRWHNGDRFLRATKSQYNELSSAEMHIAKCWCNTKVNMANSDY